MGSSGGSSGGGGGTPEEQCFTASVTDAAGPVTLEVGTGVLGWYARGAGTITAVRASVALAPDGDDIEIDVNNNGTTIFTTQSNRPIIVDGNTTDITTTIEVDDFVDGDHFTIDIDTVGTTEPGEDLIVQVWWRPA